MPVPRGLVKIRRSPGCRFLLASTSRRVNDAGHGETVLEFLVLDAVAADQDHPRLFELVDATLEDLPQNRQIHFLPETPPGSWRSWACPHGVNSLKALAAAIWPNHRVVHDGREKIDRLDQRHLVGKFVNTGVVGPLQTNQYVLVDWKFHPPQCLVQVPRRQLGGSAGAGDGCREANRFGFFHGRGAPQMVLWLYALNETRGGS